ncbi:MFS transporter [Nocardioides zeae]|uniref:MFS transporter n=1 Tax=Nocardioides imazamoxiresistens TaxID=3231893 RepID=A0ABU3PVG8_9ACTN|nr:MFS transporter [Nocardioides zeae]MDT9593194.1 MFS transporter [Nocardioides zeae]
MAERPARWSPWRTVTVFGFVSLAADMVYEGMRSVAGPYLAALGAGALVVGLVTGAGEATALVLRLVSGPLADRWGRHWTLTTVGYAMTAVCVPLLALAPHLGAAGLSFAAVLILLERAGKAVRSPSKSALLADVAREVGRGKGFAVHKALDQVGAFAGPLAVAGVLALTASMSTALALLALPGLVAMLLLALLRARVGGPGGIGDGPPEPSGGTGAGTAIEPADATVLPRSFYLFALSVACSTAGLTTFGVLSFHLVEAGLVPLAGVPLVYAGAMLVAAVGALATGWAYDRWQGRVLHVLAPLVALVPVLALADALVAVLVGLAAWALAGGVQDSTVKALVADLVPRRRLATAYGLFAAFQGAAALLGGVGAGALYAEHRGLLVVLVALLQVVAAALLVRVLRRSGAGARGVAAR